MAYKDRTVPVDVLALADLLKPSWRQISEAIPAWHPRLEDPPAPDPTPDPPTPDPEPDPALDPPKSAEEYRKELRTFESNAKKAAAKDRKRIEELESSLKARTDADKTEQERAIETARDEAAASVRAEVVGSFQERILKAEIRARAAGKFANPALAVKLVDLGDDAFTDDGDVNGDAIDAALGEILEAEPYLSVTPPSVKPNGSSDAGKGKSTTDRPDDMNDLIRRGRRG